MFAFKKICPIESIFSSFSPCISNTYKNTKPKQKQTNKSLQMFWEYACCKAEQVLTIAMQVRYKRLLYPPLSGSLGLEHRMGAQFLCVCVWGESLLGARSLAPEQLDVLNLGKVQTVRLVPLQEFKGLWTQSSSEPSKPMAWAKLAPTTDRIGLFPKPSITSTLIPARNQTRKSLSCRVLTPPALVPAINSASKYFSISTEGW